LLDDENFKINLNACYQVHGREAHLTIITDISMKNLEKYDIFDEIINIPTNGFLTGLVGVVPFQLIAYEISILKGIDPDHPRGLAKVVTVL
jgi:glutamine---fructose-6-phosphate transaminase (isomerizing)